MTMHLRMMLREEMLFRSRSSSAPLVVLVAAARQRSGHSHRRTFAEIVEKQQSSGIIDFVRRAGTKERREKEARPTTKKTERKNRRVLK